LRKPTLYAHRENFEKLFLKNFSENIEDILIEKQFKGQKLVNGWEKIAQDEENDNWVAREEEDCQQGL
jgi:hypothetical protein